MNSHLKSYIQTPGFRVAWRFALVAVASFSCWAYGGAWLKSESALYTACAAVFLGLGSLAAHPAAADRVTRVRFFLIFVGAFIAYAAAWCVFWFWLHDKRGEIFGSLVGVIAMGWIFRFAIGRPKPVFAGVAALYFWHTVGYFGGEWLFEICGGAPSAIAKLAWGFAYGLGFGAGLGTCLDRAAAEE
jgi:hypothetical protein